MVEAVIDRFEGGDAVLLVRPEERHRILVPRELLPGCAEGDIIAIIGIPLRAATDAARERAVSMIAKLRYDLEPGA
jgi:hypothetical protein